MSRDRIPSTSYATVFRHLLFVSCWVLPLSSGQRCHHAPWFLLWLDRYEAYCAGVRERNAKNCCGILCEEYCMTKADYYRSSTYAKACQARKKAQVRAAKKGMQEREDAVRRKLDAQKRKQRNNNSRQTASRSPVPAKMSVKPTKTAPKNVQQSRTASPIASTDAGPETVAVTDTRTRAQRTRDWLRESLNLWHVMRFCCSCSGSRDVFSTPSSLICGAGVQIVCPSMQV